MICAKTAGLSVVQFGILSALALAVAWVVSVDAKSEGQGLSATVPSALQPVRHQRPTAILGPRTGGIGFRVNW